MTGSNYAYSEVRAGLRSGVGKAPLRKGAADMFGNLWLHTKQDASSPTTRFLRHFVTLSFIKAQSKLGFKFGKNGTHAARTMMLDDLRVLLSSRPVEAEQKDYADAVVSDNLLGKPTKKARELAFRHLATLYSLQHANPIFRAMRRLWASDIAAQPMLAFAVSLARDPLLRVTIPFFMSKQIGTLVPREDVETFLETQFPGRFSAASKKSFAQNIAGTWTAAGFLSGRTHKTRSNPVIRPECVALCLFLAYLEGRSGQRLFSSEWMSFLPSSSSELEKLAESAAQRGQLVFMNAGGVKEVRFPDFLTSEEEVIRQEAMHVV